MARKPQIGEQYKVYEITKKVVSKKLTGKVVASPQHEIGGYKSNTAMLLHPLRPANHRLMLNVSKIRPVGILTVTGTPYKNLVEVEVGDRVKAKAELDAHPDVLRGNRRGTVLGAYDVTNDDHHIVIMWDGGFTGIARFWDLFYTGRVEDGTA